ncbi:MAG: L,D-transpeptidase [Bacteroidota bacterium]
MKNENDFIRRLHRLLCWTEGCITVTNQEMEEFYKVVPIRTAIEIDP